jgi:hypothetical protein
MKLILKIFQSLREYLKINWDKLNGEFWSEFKKLIIEFQTSRNETDLVKFVSENWHALLAEIAQSNLPEIEKKQLFENKWILRHSRKN